MNDKQNKSVNNEDDIMDVILGLNDPNDAKSNIINLNAARKAVDKKNTKQSAGRDISIIKTPASAEKAPRKGRAVTDTNAAKKTSAAKTPKKTIEAEKKDIKPVSSPKHRPSRRKMQMTTNLLALFCLGFILLFIRFGHTAVWTYYASCIMFFAAVYSAVRQMFYPSADDRKKGKRHVDRSDTNVGQNKDEDITIVDSDLFEGSRTGEMDFPDIYDIDDQMMLYIRDEKDIFRFTDKFMWLTAGNETAEDLNAEKALFNGLLLYVWHTKRPAEQKFSDVTALLDQMTVHATALDLKFAEIEKKSPSDACVTEYHLFDRCVDEDKKYDIILMLSEKLDFLKGDSLTEPDWKNNSEI